MSPCKVTIEEPPKPTVVPGSAIAARIRGFYDELANRSGVLTTAQEVELTLSREYALLTAAAVHMPVAREYGRLENFVAKALGWKSMVWQAISEGRTPAGQARYWAMDKAHASANLITYAAMYKALPDIQQLYNTVKTSLAGKLEASKLQEVLYDAIVIGQYPKLLNIHESPVVKFQLEVRFNEYQQRLIELGLNPAQRAEIEQLAGKISGHFDTLRTIASKEGLDIPVLRNGGYFPIKSTDEIARFLNTDESWLKSFGKSGGNIDTADLLKRTRRTNVALVMDEDRIAEMMGMSPPELIDWMSRPGEFSLLMQSTLGKVDYDRAIANDWLVQAPALSDELTEFFNENYSLPIRNLAEAIILDPVEAVTKYSEELEKAVKASGLMKELLTTGVENGNVLTATQIAALPNKLDYVPIGSSKFLQDLVASNDLREGISELFIHRTVAEQVEAVIKLNTSWSDLSVAARTWQAFTGVFRKSAIVGAGFGYLQRVFGQNTISLFAATGSLGQYGYGAADIARIAAAKSFDVLDNSRVIAQTTDGRKFTTRELFTAYFLKRGSTFVSGAQENLDIGATVFSNPLTAFANFKPAIERTIRLTREFHKSQANNLFTGEVLSAAELAGKSVNWMLDSSYRSLAGMNVMMDMAARWAAIRELATNGKREWNTLEELFAYTDEYFNVQEDAGSFGRWFGSVGQPFAAFALNAPGSALRHAIRNPWHAGRMGVIYSRYGIAEELDDYEMSQWQKDSYAITLYTDPTNGNRYAVFPGTIDFYLDTATQAREFTEDIGRALGLNVGSDKEIYEQQRDPGKPVMDFIQEFASNTYFHDVLAGLLEKDARTWQDLEGKSSTLLGIPMKKGIREALVSAFPVLRTADNVLPIAGTRPTIDPVTNLPIDPGKPGWLGVTPERDSGNKIANVGVQQSPIAWLAQYGLGLSVQEISPVKNLISNYKDFGKLNGELAEAINNAEDVLRTTTDDKQALAVAEEMQHMQRLRIWLEFNQYQVDILAKRYGIPSIKAVERWRQEFDVERDKTQDLRLFLEQYNGRDNSNP